MYAIVEDNNITQYINFPKSVIIGDVRYPAKIFQLWSKSEKEAIGIYEIVVDKTNFKDPEYYINTNEEYNFADNQVTRSWGTATPRRLEDESGVDDEGNEFTNYVLKTEKKRIVKQQASGLLAPTDWYVVKATEVDDYSVPENITNYRSEVRAKSHEMETQIDSCTTVEQLETLYTYTEQEDGTTTRPLAEFPKEVV